MVASSAKKSNGGGSSLSPTSSFSPKVSTTDFSSPANASASRTSPEGRSAEGSSMGGGSSNAGRREGGPALPQRLVADESALSMPAFQFEKSPPRCGNNGALALPKNPKDTATYEVSSNANSNSSNANAAAVANSMSAGTGRALLFDFHPSMTPPNSKLQRRLNSNSKKQQQQQQHVSSITGGGGSVKSGYYSGGGGAHSIGGRSYKSDTNMLLMLPPLKPSSNDCTTASRNRTYSSDRAGGGGASIGTITTATRKNNIPPPPPPVLPKSLPTTNINNNNISSKSAHSIGGGGASIGSITPTIAATSTVSTSAAPCETTNSTFTTTTTTTLDDEEQYMFEQRLTHDELGVAIRKISHSGKAQLRYVKCVVLRPPSSSDFGGGSSTNTNILANNNSNNDAIIMGVGGCVDDDGGIPGIGTYLEKKNGEAAKLQGGGGGGGCDVSVSSSVSSRFMEKIKSVVGRNNNINKNILSSNSIHGGGGGGGCGDDDDDDDNKSLLLDQEPTIGSISPTSRPGGCGGGGSSSSSTHRHPNKSLRALTWGKKNAITVPLDKFSCVRKGKTTQRTIRNGASASRLLSIVVSSGCCDEQESLDIEAPTRLDRDKFASAFARFLGVPLIEEEEYEMEGNNNGRAERSVVSGARRKLRTPSLTRMKKGTLSSNMSSAASSEPGSRNDLTAARSSGSIDAMPAPAPKFRRAASAVGDNSSSLLPALTPNSDEDDADNELAFFNPAGELKQTIAATPADIARDTATKTTTAKSVVSRDGAATPTCPSITGSSIAMSESARKRITNNPGQSESMLEPQDKTLLHVASSGAAAADEHGPTISAQKDDREDDASHISSITGGVDQEIVEELHQAIIELRAELDASRAEAARAVKVAEQAIQSAENCSSSDWNSTVTHKAAEAAAQAQKRSAEAIARARMAEERLSAERKSTAFWRRQAQAAEEEAGSLKTKSAGAEVKRAVLVEELASERRKAARMFASLRQEFVISERGHVNELNNVLEKKRAIEMEFEHVKKELMEKKMELQRIADAERDRSEKARGSTRMALSFRSSKKSSSGSTSALTPAKSVTNRDDDNTIIHDVLFEQRALALESLAQVLRRECDEIRLKSTDEINSLKLQSKEWANQADRAVAASRAETELLREKLAAESAMRLKLLNELQDIRGTVRVYCRPKPGATKPILSIPTQDILIVNEDSSPVSFKFDRVFSPGTSQYELFSELEEPIVSSLDGFNVTLLAFGQQGSGKTYSILGNCNFHETGFPCLKSHGVQLQALQQLFTIAGHRKGRYKDSFSVTMVEVHNEKLFDLVSGVSAAETDGEVVICETRRDKRKNVDTEADWLKGKLEIRTNIDGNTVVQGLVSIRINSFEDACKIWQESIANRLERLRMQGSDLKTYERNSNVITTIHIQSTNIATGVGTEGRLQFVDMAASDITQNPLMSSNDHRGVVDGDTAKFSNKSIEAFDDVVNARCQFDRSVPYRNATLTHLLRDSLEADAKVLLLCCISSDEADIDNTMSVLRFASRMQGVSIGKATKHIIGSKE